MPAPNLAPSPSPIIAAAAPAAASKAPQSDSKVSGSNGDQQDGAQPFAKVLENQMKPSAEGKEASAKTQGEKDGKADADATTQAAAQAAAAEAAQAAVPQDDPLAALAQMLAGLKAGGKDIATNKDAGATDVKAKDEKDDLSPTLIAAPMTADVTAKAVLPDQDQSEGPTRRDLPMADTAKAAANLAASTSISADASEQAGKSRTTPEAGFDTLLNASREAMAAAGNNAGAHTRATSASAATVATAQVTTPVGTHGWGNEVGEKIAWMATRNESRADLVLNPPHLGRIEVSLSVNGDQANAIFVSANPTVREALENAVPRLREVLQDAGISLGQAQVGAESFQQSANNRENGDNSRQGNASGRGVDTSLSNVISTGSVSPSQWARQGNGLVDTFA